MIFYTVIPAYQKRLVNEAKKLSKVFGYVKPTEEYFKTVIKKSIYAAYIHL
jgi:hypothetical protein